MRSVLVIRLFVDTRGVAELPRRWRGVCLPPGSHVRIDVGRARHYVGFGGEIGLLVQDCAFVEITGTDPEGLADVHRALTASLTAGARSA